MAHTIKTDTIIEAWQQACNYLKTRKEVFNLILEIEHPTNFNDTDDWLRQYNPKLFGGENINDVVNTIFPYKYYERSNFLNRQSFYTGYYNIFMRGRRLGNQSWGTYFQRLVNFSKNYSKGDLIEY